MAAGGPSKLVAVDFFSMLNQSDLVGWLCVGILLIFSIVSWAIIILKYVHITMASRQTKQFIEQCVAGASSLEDAFKKAGDYPDSPVSQLLREAYLELDVENWYRSGYESIHGGRVELGRLGIERVIERTITTEIDHLESYLVFLATTSNVCPFIGLFGTIWGIMAAFQSIGIQSSAAMSALMPGLSTALVTTAVGLLAAIPASVMYNYLTNKVRILTGRMDSFALELSNIIQKQLAKDS
jgi:biopolymer transport protein TolQ